MKTLALFAAAFFTLVPNLVSAQEEGQHFFVLAWDFSDPTLVASAGDPCATVLAYLRNEKYVLLNVAGIPGPPGVVYTLEDNLKEIAVVKCGTVGAHGDESEGGCGGGSGGSGGGGGCGD